MQSFVNTADFKCRLQLAINDSPESADVNRCRSWRAATSDVVASETGLRHWRVTWRNVCSNRCRRVGSNAIIRRLGAAVRSSLAANRIAGRVTWRRTPSCRQSVTIRRRARRARRNSIVWRPSGHRSHAGGAPRCCGGWLVDDEDASAEWCGRSAENDRVMYRLSTLPPAAADAVGKMISEHISCSWLLPVSWLLLTCDVAKWDFVACLLHSQSMLLYFFPETHFWISLNRCSPNCHTMWL